MGCYGIGISRLLAAVIEHNHDEQGIIWPPSIAPYHIYLCPLSLDDPQVAEEAERVYHKLSEQGFEVLFDDRLESAGVKFNDADLLGLPIRLTLSPRTLRQHCAEVKRRTEEGAELVPLAELTKFVSAADDIS
jgi:prolyl-tRNA synthetase